MKFTDLYHTSYRSENCLYGAIRMGFSFISLAYCIDLSGKTQFRPYVVTVDKQGSVLFLEKSNLDSLNSK